MCKIHEYVLMAEYFDIPVILKIHKLCSKVHKEDFVMLGKKYSLI